MFYVTERPFRRLGKGYIQCLKEKKNKVGDFKNSLKNFNAIYEMTAQFIEKKIPRT